MKTWSCLCWLSLVLVMNVRASTFKVGEGAADPGGAGLVPISLAADQTAVAFQFDLLYDPALISPGTPLLREPARYQVASSSPSNGVQRVVVYSLSNTPLTNGIILDLQFTPRAGSEGKTVLLQATNVLVASATATAIVPMDLVAGSFATTVDTGARFTGVTLLSPTQIELQLQGTTGRSFAFQFSGNLKDWTAFATNMIPAGGLLKLNAPVPGRTGNRFFRAARQ